MVPLGCLVLLLSANMVLVLTFHQDLQDGNFLIDAEDIFSSAGGGVKGPLYYPGQGAGVSVVRNSKDSSHYPDTRPAGVRALTRQMLAFIQNVVRRQSRCFYHHTCDYLPSPR